jgi:hypothetical protein
MKQKRIRVQENSKARGGRIELLIDRGPFSQKGEVVNKGTKGE